MAAQIDLLHERLAQLRSENEVLRTRLLRLGPAWGKAPSQPARRSSADWAPLGEGPFPAAEDGLGRREGNIECRQRLGGLLKFYRRVG